MVEPSPSEELTDEASDFGWLKPGALLGRYQLLVPIARGGMARVWAARLKGQRGFQKLVAVKTILPHLASDPEFERMFLDEARIASGVHHPNVCEIYELGEERRALYLAMEWVNGDSLARVLKATGVPVAIEVRVASRLVADACAGVHAAHELTDDDGTHLGVVHRDVSPQNILVTTDGVTKVADFGVAKALGQSHEVTSAGQLKGKISYMAPEQVTSSSAVDRRGDIFSLGCVLYEATTGVRPFRGDGDHQIMNALLKGEVAPPTSVVKGYPPDLERVVMRALSARPEDRFPTAEAMRVALEEFLARGHVITQAQVAQLVRARVGEHIERRRERIRQASSTTGDVDASMVPSPSADEQRSGVKATKGGASSGGVPPDDDYDMAPYAMPDPGRSPFAVPGHTPYVGAPTPTPPPLGMYPATSGYSSPGVTSSGQSSPGYTSSGQSSPGYTSSGVTPARVSVTTNPTSFPPVPPPPESVPNEVGATAGQYVLAALIGVVLAVVIGAAVFFFAWRTRTGGNAAPAQETAPSTSAPVAPATSGR